MSRERFTVRNEKDIEEVVSRLIHKWPSGALVEYPGGAEWVSVQDPYGLADRLQGALEEGVFLEVRPAPSEFSILR